MRDTYSRDRDESIPKDRKSKQGGKFIDKACEIGVDQDEAAFDDKLKRLARAKPKKKEGE